MKNLLSLLERFSKTLNKDSLEKEAIRAVMADIARIRLKDEDIRLDNGVLHIEAGAAAKAEIKLKEGDILRALRERGIALNRILYR